MPGKAEFKRLFDLTDLPPTWRAIKLSLDWNGQPLLLAQEGKPPYPRERHFQAMRTWRNAAPTAHHVVTFENETAQVVSFPDAHRIFTNHVQRFEDGWLLADFRWGSATVYNPSGKMLRHLDLGDAINDVQTTAQGNIWVSYFDDYVFGDSIGRAGLVCFEGTGKPIFDYREWAEKNQIPFIDGCWALNVMKDDEVWLSYHSGFPLVRIKLFELENIWKEFASIFPAFAVRSQTVIYQKAYVRNQLFKCSLDDPSHHKQLDVVDQDGCTIKGEWAIAARGPALYLMTGSAIYEMSCVE